MNSRLFSVNESKISRDREFKADKAGAEVGSSLALATALIKISLYSDLWEQARSENIERLNQGKVENNLSVIFQKSAKYYFDNENISSVIQSTFESCVLHPTDTHPSVLMRLDELGVEVKCIKKDMLLVPSDPAIELVDNYLHVEEEITLLEHRVMVAYGMAQPPENV